MPVACSLAILSRACCEKQPYMVQAATLCEQLPHWHARRLATRPTLSAFLICAQAGTEKPAAMSSATAPVRTRSLLIDNCILSCDAHHFGAGVLQFNLARHEADQSAANQHEPADPDPGDQREHVGFDHGSGSAFGGSGEIQIKVFVEALADCHFMCGPVVRLIDPCLGLQDSQHAA